MDEYLLLILVSGFGAAIGFRLFDNKKRRIRTSVRFGASLTGASIGAVFGMAIADSFHIEDPLSHGLFMVVCAVLASLSLQRSIGLWTGRSVE